MKTIKQVEIVPQFVELMPDTIKQGIVYISKKYKCAIHLCLCGYGEKVVMPLYGDGWTLIEKNDKVSFSPSIGNYNWPCQSHYIITNNKANFV